MQEYLAVTLPSVLVCRCSSWCIFTNLFSGHHTYECHLTPFRASYYDRLQQREREDRGSRDLFVKVTFINRSSPYCLFDSFIHFELTSVLHHDFENIFQQSFLRILETCTCAHVPTAQAEKCISFRGRMALSTELSQHRETQVPRAGQRSHHPGGGPPQRRVFPARAGNEAGHAEGHVWRGPDERRGDSWR